MSDNVIEVKNISKNFGGVKALDKVNLEIRKGEIHCLVGENGSGKSTLIKIISGYYKPDGGELVLGGHTFNQLSIHESIQQGIQVIYQDMSIFPNLTVAENIAINDLLYNKRKIVSWKEVHRIAQTALNHIGVRLPLDAIVGTRSVADKQLIAIARSLLRNAKLIIMDEATSALTRNEVNKLFAVIHQLKKEGISTLFVSHKLDEVFEIADSFTVFRNGKKIITDEAKNIDSHKFVYYMTGREIVEQPFIPKVIDHNRTILRVEHLCLKNGFEDISFCIHPGEILGITGLLGSGRTELAKTLFGLYKPRSGKIFLEDNEISLDNPMEALKHKIAYVPEDRLTEGLFLTQSIESNMFAANIDHLVSKRVIDFAKGRKNIEKWIRELDIKLRQMTDGILTLSGGNQQKVVLGKWLATEPKLLILNGPTIGVDIGAKFDIHNYLRELAASQQYAIIIISDDLDEILMNCNRIIIIKSGRIVSEYANTELTGARLQSLIMEQQEGACDSSETEK